MTQRIYVLPIDDPAVDAAVAGADGETLARLARAGLPVPAGFHVKANAYREFVERNGLSEPVRAAVAEVEPDLPVTAEAAARRIGELFEHHDLPVDVAGPIRWAYASMGDQDEPVAVRASALGEGEYPQRYPTYLNVRGESAVVEAVRRCWASLWSAPAIERRAREGLGASAAFDPAATLTVQLMVPADVSGVMLTGGGEEDRVVLHASWGLGDAVTGGRVTPDAIAVERGSGTVVSRRVADKAVLTVPREGPGEQGTRERPVPEPWRHEAVLTDERAAEIARLGERIEGICGGPMDVEWVLDHDGRPFVVRARRLSAEGQAPGTEVWNDSLAGTHLWTRRGLGEAFPDVLTPCSWSLIQIFMGGAMAPMSLPDHRAYGTIGGRFYLDLSMATALGLGSRHGAREQVFGPLPRDVAIPPPDVPRWRLAAERAPVAARVALRVRDNTKNLPGFLASAPARCEALRERIRAETDPEELVHLWGHEVLPLFLEAGHMLEAALRERGPSRETVRADLAAMVGDRDADALLSGVGRPGGPELPDRSSMTGLCRLAAGEIDRPTYLREWGHRGPHEFEVSAPRPAEDPAWVDAQLDALRSKESGDHPGQRHEASRAAWQRLRDRHPGRVTATRRRIGRWARAAHDREAARSEIARVFWVLRGFVRRAGEITGRGDDLYFLTIDEVLAVLDGDEAPWGRVAIRRRTFGRYRALPEYPPLVRGPFDPFAWAANPGMDTGSTTDQGTVTSPSRQRARPPNGGRVHTG